MTIVGVWTGAVALSAFVLSLTIVPFIAGAWCASPCTDNLFWPMPRALLTAVLLLVAYGAFLAVLLVVAKLSHTTRLAAIPLGLLGLLLGLPTVLVLTAPGGTGELFVPILTFVTLAAPGLLLLWAAARVAGGTTGD